MLIDTHCHLDDGIYADGTDAVLARARGAGVGHFVVIGVGDTTASARHAVALAGAHADIHAAVGFHPHDASRVDQAARDEIAQLAAHPRVVAVGEIGLDYHYDQSPREVQRETFRHFIALARALNKPVVIHTREAADDTLAILREERASEVGGIIHCFSEDVPFARAALDLGFDLSFSGIVTFKKADAIQAAARFAPADRILLETDAPYLAPVPMRGKRCEPAYVAHTARFVAQLRGVPLDELVAQTGDNAVRRLGLS